MSLHVSMIKFGTSGKWINFDQKKSKVTYYYYYLSVKIHG